MSEANEPNKAGATAAPRAERLTGQEEWKGEVKLAWPESVEQAVLRKRS